MDLKETNLMWVFGCWDVGNEALFLAVEVDEHKRGENKD